MVQDAEQHAAEDKACRESVELKNQANTIVYTSEKLLKEQGDKVDAVKKASAEANIEKLKKAIQDGGDDIIKAAIEELNTDIQKISTDLYSQSKNNQQKPPSSNNPGSGQTKDDVIDADFEMVNDKDAKP
jgi:molecular chaperone DnaK